MIQRIRNVVQVTGRRCYNVSGTSYKLLDQERLSSCWPKMLKHIRNVLQVTGRRCYNVSGTSYKLRDEDVTTYQERLTSYWTKMLQRIRKVNKLPDEDVTTYQERPTSCWAKMLQHVRNVLQVTGRRCYNVSGNRDWHSRPQDAITKNPTNPRKKKKHSPKPPLENMIKYWFGFPPV